jgi:hypothetical protein
MLAFALSLAVFGIWSLLGWALVCLLDGGRNLIRNALLSPIAGAAVVASAIFECNRWGLPVQACGPVVTVVCGATAVALIWRFGLPLPGRRLAPYLAVVAASALLVGYPMLLHGFDWLSYGNDDMANYVLGAGAYLKRGYLNSFDPGLMLQGRDMGMSQWLPNILFGVRCGSELTLAWVMSLTGLSGHQVFMPVIVALDIALICAAGALIVRSRNSRIAGLVTCSWMAVSSLVALGTLYQLIAQVFGLGLLAGAGALLLEPIHEEPRRVAVKRALLAGVFCGAIGFTYPEILPFLVLAFVLTHLLALWRRTEAIASLTRSTAITIAAAVLLWNTYVDCVPAFLLRQAGVGLRTASPTDMLFPYYLLPSGLATFWGFLPIAQPMGRPLLDIAIAAAAILLGVAVLTVLWQAWKAQPAALMTVVMLALAVRLAWMSSDFGLYKLAMYCQPFLLGSLVVAWMGRREKTASGSKIRAVARVFPIVIVAGLGLPGELHYVRLSADRPGTHGGFIEVPEASSRHLVSRLKLLGGLPHRPLVVSDTSNVVLAKLEATYFAPSRQEYPAADYFAGRGVNLFYISRWYADLVRPGYVARSEEALLRWRQMQRLMTFDMHGGPPNRFIRVAGKDGEVDYSLLSTGPALSVLDRRQPAGAPSGLMVKVVPSERVRNHLILVDSELGRHYFHSGSARGEGRVSMFQLEPDYFYPGRTMSAVGRVLLFEVLHASHGLRLQMEYTASLQSDGRNTIPPVQAIGAQRKPFGAVGRGSARLFSSPLEPQMIGGRQYVAIDMGADGRLFKQHRSGLMRWFGTSIPLDSRRINGFMRDVSAVDAEQYDNLQAPTSVSHFPVDLACKDLEYSGVYEDGWVAEESFFRLRQSAQRAQLIVRAMVPGLGQKPTTLRVFVDGSQVAQAQLRPGDNEVRTTVQRTAGLRRIDLRFDSSTALPAPDGRVVCAQLKFIGFSEGGNSSQEIAEPPIAMDDHWYPFEKFGGQTFRWVENDARFAITTPARQSGELAIDFEPGPGMGGKPMALRLVLPGGGTRVLPSATGRQTMRVPLTLSGGVNYLSLRCDGGGLAIPSDPRKLNFRVFELTWTPRSNAQ